MFWFQLIEIIMHPLPVQTGASDSKEIPGVWGSRNWRRQDEGPREREECRKNDEIGWGTVEY